MKMEKGRSEQLLFGIGAIGVLALLLFSFRTPLHTPPGPQVKPVAVPAPLSFPKGTGKISIVLDDWGYSPRQIPLLLSIRLPLTVAVLPGLPYSTQIAHAAHAKGHEVIVHMPMEAEGPGAPRETGTIMTGMSRSQIHQELETALRSVPFASGFSNHQGSKATRDFATMEVILKELRDRRLYFLDSRVTDQSVCEEVARRVRLKFARRSVFLDNDGSPKAIQERILELARLAARKGHAIGIGHDRPHTLQVLQGAVAALEGAGYTLVPVSELAEIP